MKITIQDIKELKRDKPVRELVMKTGYNNSYGEGYDDGYNEALDAVISLIEDLEGGD